jgi:hypothetical protein
MAAAPRKPEEAEAETNKKGGTRHEPKPPINPTEDERGTTVLRARRSPLGSRRATVTTSSRAPPLGTPLRAVAAPEVEGLTRVEEDAGAAEARGGRREAGPPERE